MRFPIDKGWLSCGDSEQGQKTHLLHRHKPCTILALKSKLRNKDTPESNSFWESAWWFPDTGVSKQCQGFCLGFYFCFLTGDSSERSFSEVCVSSCEMACTHPRPSISTLPVEDHPKAAILARFSPCKEKIFKHWLCYGSLEARGILHTQDLVI